MTSTDPIRLLLVEDDEEDRFLFQRLLKRIEGVSVDVSVASDISEALRTICSSRLDIIISDYVLGPETGLDLLQALQALPDSPPVIMVTGTGSTDADIACMEAGAKDYLRKGDIDVENLGRAIRYTLQQHRHELQIKEGAALRNSLFAMVSHDIRGPLYAVLCGLIVAREDLPGKGQEEVAEFLNRTHDDVERLFALTNRLLDWAGSHKGGFKVIPVRFEVADLVSDTIEHVKSLLEAKQLTVTYVGNHEEEAVMADRVMIGTILRNLLTNAIKFSPRGGTIQIKATREGQRVHVDVIDFGCGVPENLLCKIFGNERISLSGTEGESGSGLGLHICRDFASRNNGDIDAWNNPEGGATFRMTLPSCPMSSSAAGQRARSSATSSPSRAPHPSLTQAD